MKNFFEFSRYLFIFAHPDDEVYTCAFIQKLVEQKKRVDVIYVTSGDYQSPATGKIREAEVREAMRILTVPDGSITFMRVPERQLMGKVNEVCINILARTAELPPDCVISHDFEGGHNGHDAVGFCASYVAEKIHSSLYVFPAYYAWPEKRLWNQFVPPREATDTLILSSEMKILQKRVISAHASQKGYFDAIKQSGSNNLFSKREVLRLVEQPINYLEPPTTPVGYEYPGSNLRFKDFQIAITSTLEKLGR